jgi:formiminotetrahydrofolate cyclodeaminase
VKEQSLANLSLKDFLARLGSAAPTPGGGSVAALTGALAAGLGHMACALTVGKPKFADVEPQVRELATRLERSGAMLRQLIDEDAAAYGELNGAFKLDKSESNRSERIGRAAVLAAEVPLQTAAICHEVTADLERLTAIGNPNLKADVEAGSHLARAALRAAAANVRVNLPLIAREAAERINAELEQLLAP